MHEEVSKFSQFFFLRHIHIEFLVVEPIIGVYADITFFVRVYDKGVGGVFVSLGF